MEVVLNAEEMLVMCYCGILKNIPLNQQIKSMQTKLKKDSKQRIKRGFAALDELATRLGDDLLNFSKLRNLLSMTRSINEAAISPCITRLRKSALYFHEKHPMPSEWPALFVRTIVLAAHASGESINDLATRLLGPPRLALVAPES